MTLWIDMIYIYLCDIITPIDAACTITFLLCAAMPVSFQGISSCCHRAEAIFDIFQIVNHNLNHVWILNIGERNTRWYIFIYTCIHILISIYLNTYIQCHVYVCGYELVLTTMLKGWIYRIVEMDRNDSWIYMLNVRNIFFWNMRIN